MSYDTDYTMHRDVFDMCLMTLITLCIGMSLILCLATRIYTMHRVVFDIVSYDTDYTMAIGMYFTTSKWSALCWMF